MRSDFESEARILMPGSSSQKHQQMTIQLSNAMKISLLATATLLAPLCFVASARAYDPQDLAQLKRTNACPRCDLSNAPLNNLNLSRANLRNANLQGANLSRSILMGADLSNTNLATANISSANLVNASLVGANLKSATLVNANLSGAGLMAANLEAANFKGANMDLVNSRGARFQLTTMPNGIVTPLDPTWLRR